MPYPVVFEADYAEGRSRPKALFRSLLPVPQFLRVVVYAIVGAVAVVCAWSSDGVIPRAGGAAV
jgi:hypothetical protein